MKMRDQLFLALAGDTLTLHLAQAPQPRGWLARLRRRASPETASAARGKQSVSLAIEQLSGTLDQAWAALRKLVPQGIQGADLSVQLGLTHTRLGLLHQAGEGGIETRNAVIDGYVQAWMRQMWGVDPATQIIRWDRLENGQGILISCIDRLAYAELEAFAQRHGLRFVSCKPAVLDALESPSSAQGNASRLLVWTEPSAMARRSPLVQLLHCTGTQPLALWRGWVPSSENADTPDASLHGAVHRFIAANGMKKEAPLVFKHWDQTMAAVGANS